MACTETPRMQPLPPDPNGGITDPQPMAADLSGVVGVNVDLATAAPTISSISPKTASTAGGTDVTIMGGGFDKRSQVFIGNALANLTSVTANQITVKTAASPGVLGPQVVTVRNADGQTTSNANNNSASFSFYPSKLAFSPGSAYVTSGHPLGVAVGDFDEDGLTDFVNVNDQNNAADVWFNTGGGNFTRRLSFGICSTPHYVHVADMNKDGHLDFLVPCYGNNFVRVVFNTTFGDGKYGNFNLNSIGPNYRDTPANIDRPTNVVTGDVEGDGDIDIVAAGYTNGGYYITVWKNDGAAQPSFPHDGNYGTRSYANYALAMGDWNKDGKPDVAISSQADYCLNIFRNDGTGRFGNRSDYCGLSQPRFLTAGDLNKDGYDDIVVSRYESHDVAVFMNNNGNFSESATQRFFFPVATYPYEPRIADINGDGILDVAVINSANMPSNQVSLLLGKGDGTFSARTTFTANTYSALNFAIGNMDGDKQLDFVIAQRGYNPYSINVLFNQSQ